MNSFCKKRFSEFLDIYEDWHGWLHVYICLLIDNLRKVTVVEENLVEIETARGGKSLEVQTPLRLQNKEYKNISRSNLQSRY